MNRRASILAALFAFSILLSSLLVIFCVYSLHLRDPYAAHDLTDMRGLFVLDGDLCNVQSTPMTQATPRPLDTFGITVDQIFAGHCLICRGDSLYSIWLCPLPLFAIFFAMPALAMFPWLVARIVRRVIAASVPPQHFLPIPPPRHSRWRRLSQ